ncbi:MULTISPECIES: HEAT repeat domain-containing protein [unclassified Tenacibaculum]|uniref:HEAT repeat domain-containing protein n=1 Tax=unclassified Tenacibaculum TaxID=2635139 RepID=UPI001F25DCBF|nr:MULTISPECIES: HEAT repeat domain-containing protein [unclassified Tenacibaculum]MCF2874473.1 HEAT repeat domain-containing protein [Tenacibaculum sp. Cn5-1]MCF2934461.1 HEAT repeat domain-containing protein [Tenacibaculum sp. Cn5-34]MCG7510671.1 HEAT repeat domain-containing protein [Tenacibaculum sp. Cn5-46]
MKCNDIENKLIDYIEKDLTKEESLIVEKHIESCIACQKEVKEMKLFLDVIDNDIEETPSNNLKLNFETFLNKEKEQTKVILMQPKTNWKSYIRVAASILIVVSAFLIGKYQSSISSSNLTFAEKQKIEKENQVLALLENQSASKRILAVSNAEKFTTNDIKIIDALINKLFNDENVNVRLAAAEVLSKFSSLEKVKAALIKSLETEKVPSMQIELIQILGNIQEKRALEPMKELLEKEETPNYVKQEIQYNIPNLL